MLCQLEATYLPYCITSGVCFEAVPLQYALFLRLYHHAPVRRQLATITGIKGTSKILERPPVREDGTGQSQHSLTLCMCHPNCCIQLPRISRRRE
jgi:hypothetical protein